MVERYIIDWGRLMFHIEQASLAFEDSDQESVESHIEEVEDELDEIPDNVPYLGLCLFHLKNREFGKANAALRDFASYVSDGRAGYQFVLENMEQ